LSLNTESVAVTVGPVDTVETELGPASATRGKSLGKVLGNQDLLRTKLLVTESPPSCPRFFTRHSTWGCGQIVSSVMRLTGPRRVARGWPGARSGGDRPPSARS